MPILIQYLFAIGSFQGVLMACLLIVGGQNSQGNRILGSWCLFLALRFLSAFIPMNGELNAFSDLIGWSYFLPAGYGALLFLYCRHALMEQRFRYLDLWHFTPLLICWGLNLDILLAPAESKLAMVQSGGPESWRFELSNLILFFQAFIYLGFTIGLLHRCRIKAAQTLSDFNPAIFTWLWKLLVLNGVIWLFKALGSLSTDFSRLSTLGDLLIVILIYSIALAQWRNPRLFTIAKLAETPNIDDVSTLQTHSGDGNIQGQQTTDKQSGVLTEGIRCNLSNVVKQHMAEHRPYLDNQLTLTRLAEAVGLTPHHLSEVLNQQESKNFYQFVNQYRIHYFCEKLRADSSAKLLDLALESGFSSKSTFNAVFKQFTGKTPSQYREQLSRAVQIESGSA
ncbi:helix-turn-helix domain-containing protein [Shewanella aquimarina]|uniref:helix-turn-helix domain-containing protein n=1 Tax=Shewanella aquimarina TaxID=260365 RepID=UPI002014835D|nr:helix-turn-helix domain-containing protein [Shewanella aquimarina]MCL2911314.1 helix-turn-helix domain-containing protein [Shewanella aquimarina]